MKSHTELGGEIVGRLFHEALDEDLLQIMWDVAVTHHERWDGTGYPNGLKGEEIPLAGRIMAIADVYDALVSKRVYKGPMASDDAYRILQEEAGTHFDRQLVDVFLAQRDLVEAVAEAESMRKMMAAAEKEPKA